MRRNTTSSHQAWLVILTFWLAALLPAAAMAGNALRGELEPWTQLCRSSVVAPAAAKGSADQSHALFTHCSFCTLHAVDGLAPPPAKQTVLLRADLGQVLPERFLSAAVTAHAWRAAPARAPPLKS
ncbi:MAG TPA: DUF2946 family protein [Burkholderiaceae bacterium]